MDGIILKCVHIKQYVREETFCVINKSSVKYWIGFFSYLVVFNRTFRNFYAFLDCFLFFLLNRLFNENFCFKYKTFVMIKSEK